MDDVCSPARIRNVVGKYSNLRLSIAHLGGFQYEELYGLNAYFNLSAVLPDLVDTYCDILGQMDFTQEEAENICKYNALRMSGLQ